MGTAGVVKGRLADASRWRWAVHPVLKLASCAVHLIRVGARDMLRNAGSDELGGLRLDEERGVELALGLISKKGARLARFNGCPMHVSCTFTSKHVFVDSCTEDVYQLFNNLSPLPLKRISTAPLVPNHYYCLSLRP